MIRLSPKLKAAYEQGDLGNFCLWEKQIKAGTCYEIALTVKTTKEGSIQMRVHLPAGTPIERARSCRDIAVHAAYIGMIDSNRDVLRFVREIQAEVKRKNKEESQ